MSAPSNVIAFAGDTCIASGELSCVALAAKKAAAKARPQAVLVFDAATSEPVELDLRGSREDVLRRLPTSHAAPVQADEPDKEEMPRRAGRPKMGVVAREVTLLPRHWDWLAIQPGGASVALRKLVEHAMRANAGKDSVRHRKTRHTNSWPRWPATVQALRRLRAPCSSPMRKSSKS
jgi:hypothetical protein